MANHYADINLLSLFASYITQDASGKNVVVIPCEANDITLFTSEKSGRIVDASLKIRMNEMSEKTRSDKKAHARKDNFTPPTHWIKLGISKDVFESRVDSAAQKILLKHPEWQSLDPRQNKMPNGDYNPLNTEIRNTLYPIVGEMFTVDNTPAVFTGTAPITQQAPVGGFQNPSFDEDLPF